MKINVSSEQIINGLHYIGLINFDDRQFNYVLKFGVHIEQLDSQKAPENDPEKMHEFATNLFQFSLFNKEEKEIKIDKEVFAFLLSLAGNLSLTLYNDPQSQSNNNEGMMSDLLNPNHSLSSDIGVKVSISVSSSFDVLEENIPDILK